MKTSDHIKWNPDIYKCPNCDEEIYSEVPGHFASCSCYRNEESNLGGYVDQTEYYTRIGGNMIYTGRKLHNG